MTPSSAAIDLAKFYEELRLVSFQDPGGVWTIGWGHTGQDVRKSLVWTKDQADRALLRDLMVAGRQVETLCAGQPFKLNQDEYDALTDFVFNEGAGRLAESTLLKKLKARDLVGAANEFLRWDWIREGKTEVENKRLEERRGKERQLFLGYPGEDNSVQHSLEDDGC